MLIVHGIYDHGKVIITDNNPPDIKTDAEIVLKETTTDSKNIKGLLSLSGSISRKLDGMKLQKMMRKEWKS